MAEPDFLCIGCQRAGTTTLYNVLEGHPEIWLPPIKELHFFDVPEYSLDKKILKLKRRRAKMNSDTKNEKDHRKTLASAKFFETYERILQDQDFSFERYLTLFDPKETMSSGDITPAMSALPEDRVQFLADNLPNAKILLIVRNPISRVWSHANKSMRDNGSLATTSIDVFGKFLHKQAVTSRSYPSQIYLRWRRYFGDRVKYFFFEDLTDRPGFFFTQVCDFLDVCPNSLDIPADDQLNKEAGRRKLGMPLEFEDYIRSFMDEELERCAELFGGHSEAWLKKE